MTLEEAEEKLLQILKQVMEEKLTSTNVEVVLHIYWCVLTYGCDSSWFLSTDDFYYSRGNI